MQPSSYPLGFLEALAQEPSRPDSTFSCDKAEAEVRLPNLSMLDWYSAPPLPSAKDMPPFLQLMITAPPPRVFRVARTGHLVPEKVHGVSMQLGVRGSGGGGTPSKSAGPEGVTLTLHPGAAPAVGPPSIYTPPASTDDDPGCTWFANGGAELESLFPFTTVVDAHWLLKLALGQVMPERKGVVPAWQQLPTEAEVDVKELRKSKMGAGLPIGVLSYGWASKVC